MTDKAGDQGYIKQ